MKDLIEALEAALGFSREGGLTDAQAELMESHIQALKNIGSAEEARDAISAGYGSIDNHSYRHYSREGLDKVLSKLSDIQALFER